MENFVKCVPWPECLVAFHTPQKETTEETKSRFFVGARFVHTIAADKAEEF